MGSGNTYLTVDAIRKAVRYLKNQNAEKIGDSFDISSINNDRKADIIHIRAATEKYLTRNLLNLILTPE